MLRKLGLSTLTRPVALKLGRYCFNGSFCSAQVHRCTLHTSPQSGSAASHLYLRPPHVQPCATVARYEGCSRRAMSTSTQDNKNSCGQVTVSAEKSKLLLTGPDNQAYSFHAVWLRHNCHCERCRQEDSGQKTIDVHLLQPNYTISHAAVQGDNVHICLSEDADHEVVIPVSYLLDSDYSAQARETTARDTTPSIAQGSLPQISYDEIRHSQHGLLRWLQQINDYGISLMRDVPTEEGMVAKLAEEVWDVQRTIYGEVFDVISTPSPINIAYSTAKLGYHMDLVYYESPPGIQLLHCLKFDECVVGGESEFVDAWAVAEQMRRSHPQHFLTLATVPATFQKIHFARERPVHMRFQRPHIQLAPHEHISSVEDIMAGKGDIVAVVWAPAFEGPLCVAEELVEQYYEAYQTFAHLLDTSDLKLETRLQAGDMVVFNNRRMVHGRKEFQLNGGGRHLQGCYINIDEFKCRAQVLQTLLGQKRLAKKVFNQSPL